MCKSISSVNRRLRIKKWTRNTLMCASSCTFRTSKASANCHVAPKVFGGRLRLVVLAKPFSTDGTQILLRQKPPDDNPLTCRTLRVFRLEVACSCFFQSNAPRESHQVGDFLDEKIAPEGLRMAKIPNLNDSPTVDQHHHTPIGAPKKGIHNRNKNWLLNPKKGTIDIYTVCTVWCISI